MRINREASHSVRRRGATCFRGEGGGWGQSIVTYNACPPKFIVWSNLSLRPSVRSPLSRWLLWTDSAKLGYSQRCCVCSISTIGPIKIVQCAAGFRNLTVLNFKLSCSLLSHKLQGHSTRAVNSRYLWSLKMSTNMKFKTLFNIVEAR